MLNTGKLVGNNQEALTGRAEMNHWPVTGSFPLARLLHLGAVPSVYTYSMCMCLILRPV